MPVNLKLMVSREIRTNVYQPVATTQPKTIGLTRDMRKVPRQPEQVSLRTGDRVRIEVVVDQPGYVTVFNVGPTGTLNLLYPDDLSETAPALLEANQPLHVLDVEMTPPTGRERLFAIWSRRHLSVRPDQLLGMVGSGEALASKPYQATRDMVRVRKSMQELDTKGWHVAVLELDHHG